MEGILVFMKEIDAVPGSGSCPYNATHTPHTSAALQLAACLGKSRTNTAVLILHGDVPMSDPVP